MINAIELQLSRRVSHTPRSSGTMRSAITVWTIIREPANKPVSERKMINTTIFFESPWSKEPKQEPMRDRIRNGFRPKTSLYRPISITPSCKIKNDTRTDELHYTVGAVHESLLKGCRLQFLQQVGHDGGNDAVVHGVKNERHEGDHQTCFRLGTQRHCTFMDEWARGCLTVPLVVRSVVR